jgi:hypothetical protein
MAACCPPGLGCNAPAHDQPCALELCRRAASQEAQAALAVLRWTQLQEARRHPRGKADRRFRLRAYERAREASLVALLLHGEDPARPTRVPVRAPRRQPTPSSAASTSLRRSTSPRMPATASLKRNASASRTIA